MNNSAHILYIFEENERYLDNMMAYIKAGIERNHHLIIIENSNLYSEAEKRINELFSIEEKKCIHHIDNYTFYGCHGDFHIHSVVEHFGEVLAPFFDKKINIRTWAHVEWKEQEGIFSKIAEFEHLAEFSVNEMRLMSVCAYTASDVTASLQTKMMRSHEYLMTDTELVRSTLYRKH